MVAAAKPKIAEVMAYNPSYRGGLLHRLIGAGLLNIGIARAADNRAVLPTHKKTRSDAVFQAETLQLI